MLQLSSATINFHDDNYTQFRDILEPNTNISNTHSRMTNYQQQAEQQLNNCGFIQEFSAEEKLYLFENIKIKHYFNGQSIYQRKEHCDEIIFILKGTVKMAWNTENGKHVIHKFIPSGMLLNIIYFMSGTVFEHDYIAHEATVIAAIPGQVFKTILQQNSKALYQVFELICKRTRLLDSDIYHQHTQDLKSQVARQLVYLMEYFSSQSKDFTRLNIKLSQENFAEVLKTSRKSIKKELDWFVQQGIIETHYHHIDIINPDKLKMLI